MSASESAATATLRRGPILPRDAGATSLDLVIGVMAFLAAIALAGVLITWRMAETWESGLAGRLTVQILPQGAAPSEIEVAAALAVLRQTPGVTSAAALSDAENLALVEPWIGRDALIADLPFPRLLDVQFEPGTAVDVPGLTRRLKAAAPNSVVDDHGRWIQRLRAVAGSVVFGALAALLMIAIATAATVAFATRAGLAAHHEIVELLHLMGAHDRFIARAFEWHYFVGALAAATFGTLVAAAAVLAAGRLEDTGIAAVSFLPPLGLRWTELPWLILVPAGAALIAWATARLSVISALRSFY
jgi:cell division transport system permease protein